MDAKTFGNNLLAARTRSGLTQGQLRPRVRPASRRDFRDGKRKTHAFHSAALAAGERSAGATTMVSHRRKRPRGRIARDFVPAASSWSRRFTGDERARSWGFSPVRGSDSPSGKRQFAVRAGFLRRCRPCSHGTLGTLLCCALRRPSRRQDQVSPWLAGGRRNYDSPRPRIPRRLPALIESRVVRRAIDLPIETDSLGFALTASWHKNSPDELSAALAESSNRPPVSIRWKMAYPASLASFRERAERLHKMRSELDSRALSAGIGG